MKLTFCVAKYNFQIVVSDLMYCPNCHVNWRSDLVSWVIQVSLHQTQRLFEVTPYLPLQLCLVGSKFHCHHIFIRFSHIFLSKMLSLAKEENSQAKGCHLLVKRWYTCQGNLSMKFKISHMHDTSLLDRVTTFLRGCYSTVRYSEVSLIV